MTTEGKTVFVTNAPISNPDDKTLISYKFDGPSLKSIRKLTIDASREVELSVLLAHLQSMWDREPQNQATGGHQDTVAA